MGCDWKCHGKFARSTRLLFFTSQLTSSKNRVWRRSVTLVPWSVVVTVGRWVNSPLSLVLSLSHTHLSLPPITLPRKADPTWRRTFTAVCKHATRMRASQMRRFYNGNAGNESDSSSIIIIIDEDVLLCASYFVAHLLYQTLNTVKNVTLYME